MTGSDLALLLLRVALGLTLAAHGVNKCKSGLNGVARWFDNMGMRPGAMHARFAAGGEMLAGIFLAAGLLTSFAALGFVGLMTVAAVTVHLSKGFFILNEGWECVFILGVTAVAIALLGPGRWSIDRVFGIDDDFDSWLGLAIAAGGGLAAAGGLLSVFYRPPKSG
jgi:putative oxidoreductase